MDANTRDVLIATVPILGGVVVGILVARITADRSRDLARGRRRLDLVGVFLSDIETLREQGKRQAMGQPFTDWGDAQDRAHSALTQLRIVAPKLERPILHLWQTVQKILVGAQLRRYADGRDIPPEASDWARLDKEYDDAHAAFLRAAKKNLN